VLSRSPPQTQLERLQELAALGANRLVLSRSPPQTQLERLQELAVLGANPLVLSRSPPRTQLQRLPELTDPGANPPVLSRSPPRTQLERLQELAVLGANPLELSRSPPRTQLERLPLPLVPLRRPMGPGWHKSPPPRDCHCPPSWIGWSPRLAVRRRGTLPKDQGGGPPLLPVGLQPGQRGSRGSRPWWA
jgi:hypothetical protein